MDAWLYHFINSSLSNPIFDVFFPWYTNVAHSDEFRYAIIPLILIFTFYVARGRGLAIAAFAGVSVWLVDLFAGRFIKPLFLRPRPFNAGLEAILRAGKPGGTSLPSTHSLDAFFLATLLSFYFPRGRWVFFTLAFLMAFSRVYCGVHYPGDVTAGAVIGIVFGCIAHYAADHASRFLFSRYLKRVK